MKKVILFGLGKFFSEYRDNLFAEYDVVALTDNSESVRQSVSMSDRALNVIAPEEIVLHSFDAVVITVERKSVSRAIREQCIKYSIKEEKILEAMLDTPSVKELWLVSLLKRYLSFDNKKGIDS